VEAARAASYLKLGRYEVLAHPVNPVHPVYESWTPASSRDRDCILFFGNYNPAMAATAYRYLVNLPGVRGGNTIAKATWIGVHDVVGLIVNGSTVDDVVRSFRDLTRAQVYECLAYYEDHRTKIDTLVARQMIPFTLSP